VGSEGALTYGVIADGSLQMAVDKGEVKPRYWNPGEMFDEVHVITLADDDVEPAQVQAVAGRARLYVHPIGRPRPQHLWALRQRAAEVMQEVQPDVIRGHGPFLQGYYAVRAARRLKVPSFVSIHDDISIYRRFWTYGDGYARITAYQLGLKALGWERYVYRHADRLVPKYEAAARLLRRSRFRDKVEVIYNSIFLARFQDQQPRLSPGQRLRVINVGRQFDGKDQRPVIRSLRDVDAELTLIGTGPLRPALESTAREAGVAERVTFIDAVPNERLPEVFRGHHLFAMNIVQPGISMTVMEAMALGYPVVINRPRWEAEPEVCGPSSVVVDGTPEGFAGAFRRFLQEPASISAYGARSRQRIESFSGEEMERREAELLGRLIETRRAAA
jgi:glycosyltransferase involved in cell wall biosynthesis